MGKTYHISLNEKGEGVSQSADWCFASEEYYESLWTYPSRYGF